MISGLELLLLIFAGLIILLILGLITIGTFLLRRMKESIAMVPCSNCGESMPQTAIFCSNCGVRKKS